MAELEFRLPSKVPYGYVNVRATPEELGMKYGLSSPEDVGQIYANYVMAFAEAERAALAAYGKPSEAAPAASQPEVKEAPEAPPGDAQAAAQRLAGDKKPRTVDEANEMAKQVIESELGPTTVVDELNQAPWEKQASAPQPKPWEKSKQASADTVAPKAAAVIDW